MQQPPGKDDGGNGIEIDPVGGYDSTQLMDDPIPDKETNHRSYNAQEQQVPEHFTTENDFHRREAREHDVVGQDGQQSVEEHLARNEKDRIAFRHLLHQQRIDGPAETGAKGQHIANRGKVEHKTSVQYDHSHSQTSQ